MALMIILQLINDFVVSSFVDGKKVDGFIKSPISALSFILRHCGVPKSTPHSSGLARLDIGLFTLPSELCCGTQPLEQMEHRLNMKLSETSQMNSVILPGKQLL
jgi:hypothetical protein